MSPGPNNQMNQMQHPMMSPMAGPMHPQHAPMRQEPMRQSHMAPQQPMYHQQAPPQNIVYEQQPMPQHVRFEPAPAQAQCAAVDRSPQQQPMEMQQQFVQEVKIPEVIQAPAAPPCAVNGPGRLTISLFIPGPIENPNYYATLAKSWPFIFRKHWAKAKPLTGQLFLLNSLHRGLV